MTKPDVADLSQILATLPPDKVAEVIDFALFLQTRANKLPLNESTQWTDDDIQELTLASLNYADQSL